MRTIDFLGYVGTKIKPAIPETLGQDYILSFLFWVVSARATPFVEYIFRKNRTSMSRVITMHLVFNFLKNLKWLGEGLKKSTIFVEKRLSFCRSCIHFLLQQITILLSWSLTETSPWSNLSL